MLHSFKLEYNNITINTERGLVQGLCLSPFLFNLFINDLMILFRTSKIEARGYADDIVWIWESKAQAVRAIKVMKKWTEINRMEINAEKSGIMRVLKRKGKWKGVKNVLNIPEVDCYKYLGVKLEQLFLLNGFGEEIKKERSVYS